MHIVSDTIPNKECIGYTVMTECDASYELWRSGRLYNDIKDLLIHISRALVIVFPRQMLMQ